MSPSSTVPRPYPSTVPPPCTVPPPSTSIVPPPSYVPSSDYPIIDNDPIDDEVEDESGSKGVLVKILRLIVMFIMSM